MAIAETGAREGRAWLFYDGDCDFCEGVADWVAGRDRGRRLRVVAYQSAPSPPMTPALASACGEAMHVITRGGRLLRGGEAAIFTLGALGYGGLARALWRQPLRDLVGVGYGLVARVRRSKACDLPAR